MIEHAANPYLLDLSERSKHPLLPLAGCGFLSQSKAGLACG
jgi:hypothetical protein